MPVHPIDGGRFRGENLLIFIDNSAVLRCMARSASRVEADGTFLAACWCLPAFLDVRVWFKRVAPADNPSEMPSLGIPSRLSDADRYGSFRADTSGTP